MYIYGDWHVQYLSQEDISMTFHQGWSASSVMLLLGPRSNGTVGLLCCICSVTPDFQILYAWPRWTRHISICKWHVRCHWRCSYHCRHNSIKETCDDQSWQSLIYWPTTIAHHAQSSVLLGRPHLCFGNCTAHLGHASQFLFCATMCREHEWHIA